MRSPVLLTAAVPPDRTARPTRSMSALPVKLVRKETNDPPPRGKRIAHAGAREAPVPEASRVDHRRARTDSAGTKSR
ncbi:hypothetical protein GCM10012287_23720 [Streptomyces daqingensis]|uniref:Uncharacterized protein n=1 Tax=Streptomyces daqingensis TaxID=1472640 RepID=A0ABQ2M978_9ACTN|nr:hypothetical protein GCM10012287_23720 [Streptomyces daqingensis]